MSEISAEYIQRADGHVEEDIFDARSGDPDYDPRTKPVTYGERCIFQQLYRSDEGNAAYV